LLQSSKALFSDNTYTASPYIMPGTLYLIPAPLGESEQVPLPQHTLRLVHSLEYFIVERGKTARRFLKQWKTPIPFQNMTFFELNKHTDLKELPSFLDPAIKLGKNVGLMSEAGVPGVADPGAEVVRLAHQKGLKVVPLIGPSSILLALMASGLNGQTFAFQGYLPIKSNARSKRIQQLEKTAQKFNQTQIFIETPYRNEAFLKDLIANLNPKTLLTVATDLTLPSEYIRTQSVADWRKEELPDLHKRPTVFLFLP
jgi:16S rRNA (cytidine1402-2'-O)-methyltransferase